MTTTTRARSNASPVPGRRPSAGYGGYVNGANALAIDYADPVETDEVGYAPPGRRSDNRRTVPRPRPRPTAAPPARSEAKPAAAPLPIALPRAPFLVLIVALVVAGVLGVLVLNTKINENSFQLDNLRSQQHELDLR